MDGCRCQGLVLQVRAGLAGTAVGVLRVCVNVWVALDGFGLAGRCRVALWVRGGLWGAVGGFLKHGGPPLNALHQGGLTMGKTSVHGEPKFSEGQPRVFTNLVRVKTPHELHHGPEKVKIQCRGWLLRGGSCGGARRPSGVLWWCLGGLRTEIGGGGCGARSRLVDFRVMHGMVMDETPHVFPGAGVGELFRVCQQEASAVYHSGCCCAVCF